MGGESLWKYGDKIVNPISNLTFAVRIKLHLAARATIVYDFSGLPKFLKKGKTNYK